MSRMLSVDMVSLAVRKGTTEAARKPAASPGLMSLDVRAAILKTGLGLCALQITSEGEFAHLPEHPEAPLTNIRHRLAAIRTVRDCDTSVFDQLIAWRVQDEEREAAQGVSPTLPNDSDEAPDGRDKTRGTTSTAATVPPSEGWDRHTDLVVAYRALEKDWPMSPRSRGEIVVKALDYCGLAVTFEGEIMPRRPVENVRPPALRMVRAALRILVAYERLPAERKLVDLLSNADT
jgi:hypothetical protein